MTPEEDTQVMPAIATAATGPQPSSSAISAPGAALSSMSMQAGHPRPLQVADQLLRGVLQAEHQQEQDDADLGADLDELLALREREEPALAEREAAEQDERDRRDARAGRRAG